MDDIDWKKIRLEVLEMQENLRKRLKDEKDNEYERTKAVIVPILSNLGNFKESGDKMICILRCGTGCHMRCYNDACSEENSLDMHVVMKVVNDLKFSCDRVSDAVVVTVNAVPF